MAKKNTDLIGQLAERIAEIALLYSVGKPFNRPLFRTVLLGDKYPTADLLVDTLGSDGTLMGHFFVQVKGTTHASSTAQRLTVDVELTRFNRLVRLPVPAYLLAVDVQMEQTYLIATCQTRRTAVSSVTRAFPLADDAVKIALYKEVSAFWAPHRCTRRTSKFTDV